MSTHDIVIRRTLIVDGSDADPVEGDLAIDADMIVEIGASIAARGRTEIDARGMAIAPGFINMLSWAAETLIADGRSQSDIRQGVTLEVLGEGWSMGPLNDAMKAEMREQQGDIRYEIEWTTLGEFLDYLVRRGVSANVASFVGAATARIHEIGYNDRRATPDELDRMCELVRQAMREGAVGVSSSLIYTPACFADTNELIELARAAAEFDGMYISHIRSEGHHFIESLDELIHIARESGARSELYHIKAAGQPNWGKIDQAIARIEAARASGLHISADMYTYPASSTGLDTSMPPWVREGGHRAWVERLKDPEARERVKREMVAPGEDWENGYFDAGGPENILLVDFKNPALKPLTGKTIAQVAALRNTSPEDTAMDLVIEDDSRVGAVFFGMSEDNVRKEVALPWVSFGSDGGSYSNEGIFLQSSTHPRAYGNFARLLAKYVRDEKIVTLQEAVRRMTSFPATNLKLDRRGALKPGYFADVVVFDPATIQDHASYTDPHQYATGVAHVFVNGVQVLNDGEHTGAKPGRVVHGPGVSE